MEVEGALRFGKMGMDVEVRRIGVALWEQGEKFSTIHRPERVLHMLVSHRGGLGVSCCRRR